MFKSKVKDRSYNSWFVNLWIHLQMFFARFYFNDHKFVIDYAIYTTRNRSFEFQISMSESSKKEYDVVSRIWKSLYIGFEFALFGYNYVDNKALDTVSRSWAFLFIHVSLVRMRCAVIEFEDGSVVAYQPILRRDGATVSHLKKRFL